MNITYKPEAITISVKKNEGEQPVRQEREAMIAYRNTTSLGLAYLAHTDDREVVTYSVTHIASGVDVCPLWVAETEDEAQQWIAALLGLADWMSTVPRATAPAFLLLRYAIVGRLYAFTRQSIEDAAGSDAQNVTAGQQRRMESEILAAARTIAEYEKSGGEALDFTVSVLLGMLAGLAGVSTTNSALVTHTSCFDSSVTAAISGLVSTINDKI